jgi:3-hydroxyisobutyrate dehydrogenase-like beta-hydroxyacid dehydrogenase
MNTIAFLGLGVMGFPMAGHLAKTGFDVRVWNRTGSKSAKWTDEYAGSAGESAAETVIGCDLVFMCLGDDPDVETVAEPILEVMKQGSVLVDHTTASAELARTLFDQSKARGIGFLDAPVSGGQAGAENGQLSVMVGGESSDLAKAEKAMQSYSKAIVHAGPAGSGQLTKMVNQICIAGLVQGLSEGLHFAQKAGLDPETVIGAVSKGAAQSWQMENRWETMVNDKFDYGFAVEWMRKDLRIAFEEARRNGARLPIAAIVDQFYAEIESMGGRRWDTSSLIARLNAAEKS